MKYDEYQLFTRYRLGYYSLILTGVLLALNIAFSVRQPWGSITVQMGTLIYIPVSVFITGAVFRNAYFEIGAKQWVWGALLLGVSILAWVTLPHTSGQPILQNGLVTEALIRPVSNFFSGYLGAIILLKAYLNHRQEKAEETPEAKDAPHRPIIGAWVGGRVRPVRFYDEYQHFTRYRLGYYTFAATEILIVLNASLCIRQGWASAVMQLVVLLYIPALIFSTGAVFGNAYGTLAIKHSVWGWGCIVVGLPWMFRFFVERQPLLQDGMLADKAVNFFLGSYWLYLGAIILIKAYWNRRKEKEGEEQA